MDNPLEGCPGFQSMTQSLRLSKNGAEPDVLR
jgi:hypothetical protein